MTSYVQYVGMNEKTRWRLLMSEKHISLLLLGRHGSASLCRVERENKMAATYNVLAFKR